MCILSCEMRKWVACSENRDNRQQMSASESGSLSLSKLLVCKSRLRPRLRSRCRFRRFSCAWVRETRMRYCLENRRCSRRAKARPHYMLPSEISSGHGLQPVRFFMHLGPAARDEILSPVPKIETTGNKCRHRNRGRYRYRSCWSAKADCDHDCDPDADSDAFHALGCANRA
jgi:hypothetical protein